MVAYGQHGAPARTDPRTSSRSGPLASGLRWRRPPRWLREGLFVGLIYLAYEASRGMQQGAYGVASRNGWDILRWERAWDLDPERLLSEALVHVTALAVLAAYFYATMHYIVTPAVLVWLYRRHPEQYRTARTALAIATVLSLAVYYVLPTAPPRLLRGAGIPDVLAGVSNWGWWGSHGSVPRGLGSVTNQFAAMPSLHVGWALWCGFLLARYCTHTWVRWLGAVYPLATTVVVLSTGNHYLLDALAGALVIAVGAVLALGVSAAGTRLRCRRVSRMAEQARIAVPAVTAPAVAVPTVAVPARGVAAPCGPRAERIERIKSSRGA